MTTEPREVLVETAYSNCVLFKTEIQMHTLSKHCFSNQPMPKDGQTLGQHSVPSIIICQKAPSITDIIVKITPSSLKKQTINY